MIEDSLSAILETLRALTAKVDKLTEGDGDKLLSLEDAAKVVGMTPMALAKRAYRKSVPSVRVGRYIRFRRADLVGGAR